MTTEAKSGASPRLLDDFADLTDSCADVFARDGVSATPDRRSLLALKAA